MPDISTEVAIATTTLGSAASSITFSSIPGTYTDLRLVVSELSSSTATQYIKFNGDTGSNYSTTILWGIGSSYGSFQNSSSTGGIVFDYYMSGGTTTIPAFKTVDLMSYAGSTYKTVLVTNSNDHNGSGAVERSVGLWRSTSAITSILISRGSGTFNAGTTATLYGIL